MSEALSLNIRRFAGEDALPAACAEFLQDLERAGGSLGLAWLDNFRCSRVLPGSQFRLYALENSAKSAPVMCMPAIYSRLYAAHPRARVIHFLQPDGDAYEPIAKVGAKTEDCVPRLFAFLEAELPRCDVLRFSPLNPGSPFAGELMRTLSRARWPRRVEKLPSVRYLATHGRSHEQIMAERPPSLRGRLEAGARGLGDTGRASFRIVRDLGDVVGAWQDYCAIVGDELFEMAGDAPEYIEGVMRVAAAGGTLRMGFLDLDGAPASVQVWRLTNGNAHCLRVWTDLTKREQGLSELLTAHMTRLLIDDDRARELHFGAFSDAFAADWAPEASPRLELIAFNPHTGRGVRGAIRHLTVAALRAGWRLGRRAKTA
jgi:broad specificity phosphatase PhoE